MYRAEGKRQKQYNSDALADIKRNKDAYLAIVHIVQEWRHFRIAKFTNTFNWSRFLKANNVSIFKLQQRPQMF